MLIELKPKSYLIAFNERGAYRTICLTGEDSQEIREKAIARLTGTGRIPRSYR